MFRRPVCVNPYPAIPASTTSRDLSGRKYSTARVDAILKRLSDKVLAVPGYFTASAISLNIGGDNGTPSGTYQAGTGPGGAASSGMEAIYALNHVAGHPWTITYNGGVAIQKLIGNDDKSWSTTPATANTMTVLRFAAIAGTLGEIRVKCRCNGNIQVAIYSDNAGSPGTVLAYAMAAPVVAGWNTIPLNTTVNLSAASYWLAFVVDTTNLIWALSTGATMRYESLSYGNAFPDNPTGLSSASTDFAIAGWGIV